MKEQKGKSALAACFFRERKRYFSSSAYVMNTAVGYIMTVVFVCVFAFGEMKALLSQVPSDVVAKLAPFCIAAFANIQPTTANAISIEGKHFWLTQTLPVRMRDIAGAKLLLGLTLSVPCVTISSVIVAIAIRPSALDLFWLLLVSLLYAVFGCVLGLFVNLKLPMLHWDHESQPIKQSKAVLVMMFFGFVTAAAPAVLLLIFRGVAAHIAIAVISLAVLLTIRALYRWICNFDLRTIAED
jgi:ABC-2 type transport system permease protein